MLQLPHLTKRTPVRGKRYSEWSAWQAGQSMKRLRALELATAGVGSKTKPPRSLRILPVVGRVDSASDMERLRGAYSTVRPTSYRGGYGGSAAGACRVLSPQPMTDPT